MTSISSLERQPIELPRAAELYARARRSLPGGNTRTTLYVPPSPPYAQRGEGCRLHDVDGNEVIDLQNNYTSLIHGHGHPAVLEAARSAIADGSSFGLPTEHEIEMADELARRLPAGERWRFANSGTEAVMMAIRAARAATGRDAIIRFEGCYHGTYDGAEQPDARGVPAGVAGDVLNLPRGDASAFERVLERDGERVAAVLLDVMPNRAGLQPAEPEFVRLVRQETQRRGILLILDEVITFRIAYGGMQSLYGVTPDLITLGKVIGGGFPVGAIGGRADVMEVFDPRAERPVAHGGTFSANPVTIRAGLAALQALGEPEIDRINRLGDRLRAQVSDAGFQVAGRGSLLRVLTGDPHALWWRLYREGVLIAANGLACVSTPMDEAVIDAAGAAFRRAARG